MKPKQINLKLFIDRALSRSIWRQLAVMAIFLLMTLILSFGLLSFSGCEWKDFCDDKDLSPWLLPIYLLIDTNALNTLYINGHVHGWMLFACSLIYLAGLLIFNGMLIGIITNYIEFRVENHRNGLIHYVKSGHCIIMGYDDMVPSLLTEIFSQDPESKVVLLTSVDAKTINEKLRRSVARDKMDQIFITYGHRMVQESYKDIHLESANEVYIVGYRTLPAHDATNIECINSIVSYLSDTVKPIQIKQITCVYEDLDTYASFKTTEIFHKITELGIAFVPYNFYSAWAKQVFVRRSYKEKCKTDRELAYPSIYGNGITPEDKRSVHLVFVGMSNFSVAFAMEAANMLHFPNFEKDNNLRTRITFIDKKADEEVLQFTTRNRHFFEVQSYWYSDLSKTTTEVVESSRIDDLKSVELSQTDFLDIEFEFIKGDIYAHNVQSLISRWAKDEGQYLSLFLAMLDQRCNFMIGMNLPDEVYDRGIPVFIRQSRADDFVTSLREADDKEVNYFYVKDGKLETIGRKKRYANIYPFGMDDMAYCSEELFLKQAKLINYLYCNCKNNRFPSQIVLDTIPSEKIWEEAESLWRDLSVALRWSNLYASYSLRCKLDSLRAMRGLDKDDASRDMDMLSINEEKCLAIVEHNRWNVEKLLMGFRKARPEEDKYDYPMYAKEFNRNNKKQLFIHHDIRPFEDLDTVRELDIEFSRFIPWILKMTCGQAK